jgi:hypothetical protein
MRYRLIAVRDGGTIELLVRDHDDALRYKAQLNSKGYFAVISPLGKAAS